MRELSRQRFVEDRRQAVLVGGRIDRRPTFTERMARLLGSNVRGSAEELAGTRDGHRGRVDVAARDTEVGDLEDVALVEHQVLGLHVAVKNPLLVYVVQPRGGRHRRRNRRLERHARGEAVRKGAARQELHHQQAELAHLAIVVDRHDVRVVHLREDPRLSAKPGAVLGGSRRRAGELFDRDDAPELTVTSAPHHAERPTADLVADVVVGKRFRDIRQVGAHRSQPGEYAVLGGRSLHGSGVDVIAFASVDRESVRASAPHGRSRVTIGTRRYCSPLQVRSGASSRGCCILH